MIRSANHSSYPRIGDSPLDQQLRTALSARERGRVTDDEVRAVEDEVATLIVADQARAFIDIVTDGMVRWEGPLSHLVPHVSGLALGPLSRWFDTNFYDRQVRVVGPLARRGPFLVHDFEVAREVAQRSPVKTVFPGPVTFARLASDRHYADRAALALALADVLAEEAAALRAAGARCFQLDEPLLCRYPEDVDLVARTAERVFAAAGPDDMTVLSTYFGDLAPLAGRLEGLPGSHLGLDMCTGDGNWKLLERLPAGRGVVLGLFDARSSLQEDAADVAARVEPYREALAGRDVVVGPNAGLELLPRHRAFDKLLHARYLVEKLTADWS